MAYHCKLYAVQRGLALCKDAAGDQAAEAKNYLIGELGDLEQMKAGMGDVAKDDLKFHVENFVLSVFAQTDKEERTCETVTKKNAIDFKRTGDFIAVLTCFGELNEEWAKRKKYCTYKAGTIMKALKAGEEPVRGNPFEPEEEKKEEEASPLEEVKEDPNEGAASFPSPQQPQPSFQPQQPAYQPTEQQFQPQ